MASSDGHVLVEVSGCSQCKPKRSDRAHAGAPSGHLDPNQDFQISTTAMSLLSAIPRELRKGRSSTWPEWRIQFLPGQPVSRSTSAQETCVSGPLGGSDYGVAQPTETNGVRVGCGSISSNDREVLPTRGVIKTGPGVNHGAISVNR